MARQGRMDAAESVLVAALEARPSDAMLQFNLGNILYGQGAGWPRRRSGSGSP